MKHLISIGAVLALIVATTAMPRPAAALDLGKTVDRVSRDVSRTVDKVTGGGSTSNSAGGGTSSAGTSGGGGSVASASASIGKTGVKAKVGSSLLGTEIQLGALGPGAGGEVGAQLGNSRVGAAVLSKKQLATLRVDANPPGTGNVALPGSGVTPGYARALLASLNRSEELVLMQRCSTILRSPKAFDAELVLLCRLVQQM